MLRPSGFAMMLALALPSFALAQGSGINGPNAGAVHGQNWTMRQDLASPTAPGGPAQTRTQRLRQQAAQPESRRPAAQRPAAQRSAAQRSAAQRSAAQRSAAQRSAAQRRQRQHPQR